ncbi:MAG TPA: flagellar basal body rod protein FlgB [Verrucomicrobiae bacterium]|nr:flagellar basal body rod protein FlgB [Verrucomicrobiae bacterium]
MIDALFNDINYIAAKKMMDATTLRHEAIASNLANVDTPNYKRLDVDSSFSSELSRALASANADQLDGLQPKLSVDTHAIAQSRDGNTVNLEAELVNLQQNTVAYAVETQVVNYDLTHLQTAITGKTS